MYAGVLQGVLITKLSCRKYCLDVKVTILTHKCRANAHGGQSIIIDNIYLKEILRAGLLGCLSHLFVSSLASLGCMAQGSRAGTSLEP